MSFSKHSTRGIAFLSAGLALVFTSCKKREVAVYSVVKERAKEERPAGAAAAAQEPAGEEEELPDVKWTLPAGWKDMGADAAGGPVRAVGSFTVEGSDAVVNITPLGAFAGKESMLVNMWRSVFGLDALPDGEAGAALSDVPVAGGQGKIFDLTGTQRGKQSRIVTAMLHRGAQSWFFKLQGSPDAVEKQVASFRQFLASIRFEEHVHTPGDGHDHGTKPAEVPAKEAPAAEKKADAPAVAAPEGLPAGWTALAPGPMQAAKFSVPDKDGAKAEVTVSVFPSDTGGALANVNRWRGQVGLPAVDEAGLAGCTSPLDPALPGALLADLKGESKSMLGAIVPRGGEWFFYKLTGDAAAVSAAREAFVSFIRTAK